MTICHDARVCVICSKDTATVILIQVAREYSGVSSLGASALELPRTADDKSMDSHHTTGLTATLSGSLALNMFQSVHNYVHNYTCRCHSIIIMLHTHCSADVSSFASTHYHSSLGFETSSAQRFV